MSTGSIWPPGLQMPDFLLPSTNPQAASSLHKSPFTHTCIHTHRDMYSHTQALITHTHTHIHTHSFYFTHTVACVCSIIQTHTNTQTHQAFLCPLPLSSRVSPARLLSDLALATCSSVERGSVWVCVCACVCVRACVCFPGAGRGAPASALGVRAWGDGV